MRIRAALPAVLVALTTACGDSVVLSDAGEWLELRYRCDAFESVAHSEAQIDIVREYANRIVLLAAQENRFDSVGTVVDGYSNGPAVRLEEAVVQHLCRDGRIAERAQLAAALTEAPDTGRGDPPISREADSAYMANIGRVLLPGRPAPDFIAPWLDSAYLAGRPDHLALSDLRGNWVILDFWATWCGPCRRAHPGLVAFAERYADRNLRVVGIDHRDWPDDALEYLSRDLGNAYRSVVDEDVRIANAYGVYGIPQVFLIDPDGIIAARGHGPDQVAEYFEGQLTARRGP
jgi:thiol-disulfide isomerase/thioredoxin